MTAWQVQTQQRQLPDYYTVWVDAEQTLPFNGFPSHVDDPGNELADTAAKDATSLETEDQG